MVRMEQALFNLTKDFDKVKEIVGHYPEWFNLETFDLSSWMKKEANLTFIREGDAAFAELCEPGVYRVHLCLHKSKGKEAIKAGKQLLKQLVSEAKDLQVVVAFVHVENRPARFVTRKVGFRSIGYVVVDIGLSEFFCITKEGIKNL